VFLCFQTTASGEANGECWDDSVSIRVHFRLMKLVLAIEEALRLGDRDGFVRGCKALEAELQARWGDEETWENVCPHLSQDIERGGDIYDYNNLTGQLKELGIYASELGISSTSDENLMFVLILESESWRRHKIECRLAIARTQRDKEREHYLQACQNVLKAWRKIPLACLAVLFEVHTSKTRRTISESPLTDGTQTADKIGQGINAVAKLDHGTNVAAQTDQGNKVAATTDQETKADSTIATAATAVTSQGTKLAATIDSQHGDIGTKTAVATGEGTAAAVNAHLIAKDTTPSEAQRSFLGALNHLSRALNHENRAREEYTEATIRMHDTEMVYITEAQRFREKVSEDVLNRGRNIIFSHLVLTKRFQEVQTPQELVGKC
jgi:hypothetical protein